jgi:hypothetical protein
MLISKSRVLIAEVLKLCLETFSTLMEPTVSVFEIFHDRE